MRVKRRMRARPWAVLLGFGRPMSEANKSGNDSAATRRADLMPEPREAKDRLRSAMRARRAGLSAEAVAAAGVAAVRRLESLPAIAAAGRVAAYRAVRGEVPLDELLRGARREVFTVPRVVGADLEFVAWLDGQSHTSGSFGISEPVDGELVALADHDTVLVPLVAFDGHCHRLGQGGGFYDRALAELRPEDRPVTIGVAHWFQRVERVPTEQWDVPLDAVVTDRNLLIAKESRLR